MVIGGGARPPSRRGNQGCSGWNAGTGTTLARAMGAKAWVSSWSSADFTGGMETVDFWQKSWQLALPGMPPWSVEPVWSDVTAP